MGNTDIQSGVLFGRYRLIRRLATGGMGEIFLAEMDGAAGIKKKVVIKRILPHLAKDPRFVERFLDEGRIVAQLSHSTLVPVFEVGSFQDQYFMAMEFVEGVDMEGLRRNLEQNGSPIPPAAAATIMHKVARGLDYVHGCTDENGEPLNIIHRDISPHNIMATPSGDIKILDFGIARARSRVHQSMPGFLAGKLPYMAPEQIKSGETTQATDIYALGAVIYELVSGQAPHRAMDEQALMRRISTTPAAPIQSVRPNLPPSLAKVLDDCISHDPMNRLSSAAQLTNRIEQAIREDGLHGGDALLRKLVSEFRSNPTTSNSFDELLIQQLDRDLNPSGGTQPIQSGTQPARTGRVDSAPMEQDAAFRSSHTELPEMIEGEPTARGFKRWIAVATVVGVIFALAVVAIVDHLKPPNSSASQAIPKGTKSEDASSPVKKDPPPDAISDGQRAQTPAQTDVAMAAPDISTAPRADASAPKTDSAEAPQAPDIKSTRTEPAKTPPINRRATATLIVKPPSAEIWVKNRRVGVGKKAFKGLKGRKIVAQVRAKGFESRKVRLTFGATRTKTVRLKAKKQGSLRFRFFPARALVYVDGKKIDLKGGNRFNLPLSVGRHKIRLVDPANKVELTRSVEIEDGRATKLGTLELR